MAFGFRRCVAVTVRIVVVANAVKRFVVVAGADLRYGVSRTVTAGIVAPSAAMCASACAFATTKHSKKKPGAEAPGLVAATACTANARKAGEPAREERET
jgi:hypothetical protein